MKVKVNVHGAYRVFKTKGKTPPPPPPHGDTGITGVVTHQLTSGKNFL